jgi:hypothetical protein
VVATGLNEGAAGTFSVHRPDPGQAVHSLAEIAVTLAGVPATVLEVGWMVSPTALGDREPRLFVHAWRGDEACPHRCGFALMAGAPRVPGDALPPGHDVRLELSRRDDGWWVIVDGRDIGRFEAGAATSSAATNVQWFGELLFTGGTPVAEMGSGRRPPDEGAARVDELCVRPSRGDVCSAPAALRIQETDPEAYPVRVEGRDRLRYGGGAEAVRPRPPPS